MKQVYESNGLTTKGSSLQTFSRYFELKKTHVLYKYNSKSGKNCNKNCKSKSPSFPATYFSAKTYTEKQKLSLLQKIFAQYEQTSECCPRKHEKINGDFDAALISTVLVICLLAFHRPVL